MTDSEKGSDIDSAPEARHESKGKPGKPISEKTRLERLAKGK